jgi:16S rRNA (cytosine967-C5)-methyltransferase
MHHAARIHACIELLDAVTAAWDEKRALPMDSLMASYFRARRYIGAKDRAFIADFTYLCLRNMAALEWHITHYNRAANPRRIAMAALYFIECLEASDIVAIYDDRIAHAPAPLSESEQGLLERWEGKGFDDSAMPEYARANVPDWAVPYLRESLGEGWEAEAMALNEQAPIDLRVNTLRCPDRETLIDALREEGIEAEPTPHSPLGVRVLKRFAAHNTEAFKQGWYEMQDEGSQLVAELVDARAGEKVIDFCAGAGGKTLAIAALMQNKGRILALDTAEHRLKQIRPRLARAGVDNVQLHVLSSETDPWLKRHRDSADWVLVDAPCSGSGTWRRNPDLKWRFGEEDLAEVRALQTRILDAAAALVKPDGFLVYVTCSLFAAENNSQIEQFLSRHEHFRVAPLPELWNNRPVAEAGDITSLQLTPLQDGTDGFFAAILWRHPG